MADLTAAELEELRRLHAVYRRALSDVISSVLITGTAREPTEEEARALRTMADAMPALLDAAEQNARRGRLLAECRDHLNPEDLSMASDLYKRIDAELAPRPDPKRDQR
jgi:hypothetical protein